MRFDENLYTKMTLTGNSVDSDVFDLGSAEIALGQPAYVVITATDAVTAATKVELKTSATNGSDYVTIAAGQFAASAPIGTQVTLAVPPQCSRYLKLVATGTSMGGKLEAGLTAAADTAKGIEDYAAN